LLPISQAGHRFFSKVLDSGGARQHPQNEEWERFRRSALIILGNLNVGRCD
jgi:hypothetical protein